MDSYAGSCGDYETLPFLYPCTSKSYRSYTDTDGTIMKGCFVIKLRGCYLFCYYGTECFHRLSPTPFSMFLST